ncbi:MAG: hypothetical protein IJB17_06255 [Oscillospiraceae bacterium]|nr:hypothetical protein [Oscillospiraceae bacterium]
MDKAFLEELLEDPAVVDAILQEHQRTVSDVRFQHTLAAAVERSGGRNLTAIRALLDEQGLKDSEDVESAVAQAVAGLKKDHGYLFFGARQPYGGLGQAVAPQSFGQKELEAMTMAEYRRWRMGAAAGQ